VTTLDDELGDELVPEEWPTFFTMVPVWLLLSGCSAQAYRMYAFLAEHIAQRTPGRRIACPKQVAIARALGLNDDRGVARYRQELEALGAIRVETYRYDHGMRRGYRYFVRFNPPEAFDGLLSLTAFYEANPDVRSAKSEGRTAAAKAPQPSVPAQAGPSDAEAGTSSASAPKAPSKTRKRTGAPAEAALPADVQEVLSAFPEELRAAMRETAHTDAPKTLVTAASKALQERSVEQLVARVGRRWHAHGYEAKFRTGELARPVGAAVAMLRPGECPVPLCEDGTLLTGGPCRACEMRGHDHRANRAAARRAERAEKQRAACPSCEQERGTAGLVCDPCRDRFEGSVVEAADRAAADVEATPGRTTEDARQAHAAALAAAAAALAAARRAGATDLGQLGQAQLAAEEHAARAHRTRLGLLPEGQPPTAEPQGAPPPTPCAGSKADGSRCHRTTEAPDGLCSPCRAVQGLQQAGALVGAL
jgi:hypothetical protein